MSHGIGIFPESASTVTPPFCSRFRTVVAVGGKLTLSGGTSASAPIFAAFIAVVNDARLAVGKGPVGWINPAVSLGKFNDLVLRMVNGRHAEFDFQTCTDLFKLSSAFNDIKNGSNPGCGTEGPWLGSCHRAGYAELHASSVEVLVTPLTLLLTSKSYYAHWYVRTRTCHRLWTSREP